MKRTYRVLAYLIAAEVVIQAAAIAYAVFGLGHYIDGGAVVDKASQESGETFDGVAGFIVHGINGEIAVPVLGLALLIIAFLVKSTVAVRKAAVLFGLIVIQVLLGLVAHSVPILGALHGIVAIGIFIQAFLMGRSEVSTTPKAAAPAAVL